MWSFHEHFWCGFLLRSVEQLLQDFFTILAKLKHWRQRKLPASNMREETPFNSSPMVSITMCVLHFVSWQRAISAFKRHCGFVQSNVTMRTGLLRAVRTKSTWQPQRMIHVPFGQLEEPSSLSLSSKSDQGCSSSFKARNWLPAVRPFRIIVKCQMK